jgi:hypothetical protein
MLELVGLAVAYPNGAPALQATTLTFPRGGFTVLLGPSGAGKSTLLRTLNGLVAPTAGTITVAGIGGIARSSALRRSSVRRQPWPLSAARIASRSARVALTSFSRDGASESWPSRAARRSPCRRSPRSPRPGTPSGPPCPSCLGRRSGSPAGGRAQGCPA